MSRSNIGIRLAELLNLQMPTLPTATQRNETILVSQNGPHDFHEEMNVSRDKWEDEEERRFYEEIQDLRDYVPKGVLGLDDKEGGVSNEYGASVSEKEKDEERKQQDAAETDALEKELKRLELKEDNGQSHDDFSANAREEGEDL